MSRDYFSEFETQQEKLEVLLEENDLLHEFDTERYPITLTIRPNITPEAQRQATKMLLLWLQADHAARMEQAGVGLWPDESCGAV